MIVRAARPSRPAWTVVLVRGLGVATAVLLAIDAYVHFNDAGLYDIGAGGAITQGSLFRAQASIAVVVAIALLVRPNWIVWMIAVLVAGGAATAVYLYTSVDIGRLGPVPDMYDPTWALPGKRASAVAETVATGLSAAGLLVAVCIRRRPAVKDDEREQQRVLPSPSLLMRRPPADSGRRLRSAKHQAVAGRHVNLATGDTTPAGIPVPTHSRSRFGRSQAMATLRLSWFTLRTNRILKRPDLQVKLPK